MDASEEDIKNSFRCLAWRYHPDLNPGNKDAEEHFKEISEAFRVLSNDFVRPPFEDIFKEFKDFEKVFNEEK